MPSRTGSDRSAASLRNRIRTQAGWSPLRDALGLCQKPVQVRLFWSINTGRMLIDRVDELPPEHRPQPQPPLSALLQPPVPPLLLQQPSHSAASPSEQKVMF